MKPPAYKEAIRGLPLCWGNNPEKFMSWDSAGDNRFTWMCLDHLVSNNFVNERYDTDGQVTIRTCWLTKKGKRYLDNAP